MPTARFAPSPTGPLHLGHAHAAIFAAHAAEPGGRFLVRIEDIDGARCRPEFATAILDDLAWLGLDWERPERVQSEHMAEYRAALARLDAMGLLYPCFCTRADIAREIGRSGAAPHGTDGPIYPGICRALPEAEARRRMDSGEGFALRLRADAATARSGPLAWRDEEAGEVTVDAAAFGDVVLARKDTPASYHLCVALDDALQGVELVTRGRDLFTATSVHRLLQALLALPVPRWHHHDLLTDAKGKRLAKRDRAATLAALRAAGKSPAAVRALAGFPD